MAKEIKLTQESLDAYKEELEYLKTCLLYTSPSHET